MKHLKAWLLARSYPQEGLRKDGTSQQFFRLNTHSKLQLCGTSSALPSSWEISSLPNNSRETELQIPLTWTLRQQLGYCESLTAGNNPASLGETPNTMQYPPPYTLVHKSQHIWKESQGFYCLLEREMSVCLKKIPQQEGPDSGSCW